VKSSISLLAREVRRGALERDVAFVEEMPPPH